MLDAAARRHLEAEYDEWRSGFTLPALDSEITPAFKAMALRMYRLYGADALGELKRIVTDRCGDGSQL